MSGFSSGASPEDYLHRSTLHRIEGTAPHKVITDGVGSSPGDFFMLAEI